MSERLGRPVHELEEQLTVDEVFEYRAFWSLKAKAEKEGAEKAAREAELKGRRGRRRR